MSEDRRRPEKEITVPKYVEAVEVKESAKPLLFAHLPGGLKRGRQEVFACENKPLNTPFPP